MAITIPTFIKTSKEIREATGLVCHCEHNGSEYGIFRLIFGSGKVKWETKSRSIGSDKWNAGNIYNTKLEATESIL